MKTIKAISFIELPDKKHIRKDIEIAPEKFVNKILNGSRFQFGAQEIVSNGIYKEMGYIYNLRPFLKKYLVKQYDNWQEMYALNKTNARKLTSGRIQNIIEIL